MKRRRQVFLLVITTALAVSSVSALEGNREIPARLLPVPDTVSPAKLPALRHCRFGTPIQSQRTSGKHLCSSSPR
jgi:hypothetical protein